MRSPKHRPLDTVSRRNRKKVRETALAESCHLGITLSHIRKLRYFHWQFEAPSSTFSLHVWDDLSSNFNLNALTIYCCWACMWNPGAGYSSDNDSIRPFLLLILNPCYDQLVTWETGEAKKCQKKRQQDGQVFSSEGNASCLLCHFSHLERKSWDRSDLLLLWNIHPERRGGLREKQWVCVLGVEGAEGAGGVSPSMLTLRKDEGERKKAPFTCGPIHNPSTWGLLYGAGIKARTREEPDTSHAQYIASLKVRHFSFLRLSCVACGILIPRPRIKPVLPALRAQS